MGDRKAQKIIEAIRRLSTGGELSLLSGEVQSVNQEERTCDIKLPNGAVIFNVILQTAMMGEAGIFTVPKVGAHLLAVGRKSEDFFYMYDTDQVEKIIAMIGEVKIDIGIAEISIDGTAGEIPVSINGGGNEGLVKVLPLTSRLNKVEIALSDLISKYNTHTHPYVDTGAPPTPPPVTSPTLSLSTQVVTQTQKGDIENPKVKH